MFNFSYIPQPPLVNESFYQPSASLLQRRDSTTTAPQDWYAYSNLNAESVCSSSAVSSASSSGFNHHRVLAANLSFKIYPSNKKSLVGTPNCLSSCNFYENSSEILQQQQKLQKKSFQSLQQRPAKFQTFSNSSRLARKCSLQISQNKFASNDSLLFNGRIMKPISANVAPSMSLKHSKSSAFKLVKQEPNQQQSNISENSPADFTPLRKSFSRRKQSFSVSDKPPLQPKEFKETCPNLSQDTNENQDVTSNYDNNISKENSNLKTEKQEQGSFKLCFKQNNLFDGLFSARNLIKKNELAYDNKKIANVEDLIDDRIRNSSPLKRKVKGKRDRKCVAICDYKSLYSKNISLKKNEEYIILNDDNENWKLLRDKFGTIGYAPSTYLQEILDENESNYTNLTDKSWFHENITRMQAYLLLTENNCQNGTFLIRNNSSDKGKYTLCLYKNCKVYNYKIQVANEFFFISPKTKFTSLAKLVEFYKTHTSGLVCQLKYPLIKKSDEAEILEEPEVNYKKFHIDRKDLEFLEKIGSGQFGIVVKAEYKTSKTVAVKKMKPGSVDDEINFNKEAEFMMKLQNLQELQHRNVVQFYGVSRDTDNTVLIVTEYVKYGSLSSYLSKNKERIIKSKNRVLRLLNVCIDVCDGMNYLESKHIIHRDLATRNCLVGENEVVKVADFGLARFTEDCYIANPESQFPVKWSAPEVIKYRSYSNKSDVWSFSCLMYEVFSMGKMPYGSSTSNAQAAKQIIAGIVPEKPQYCPYSIYDNIMLRAWDKESSNRPSFKQLFKTLNDLVS